MVKPRERSNQVPVHHRYVIWKPSYKEVVKELKEAKNHPELYREKRNRKLSLPYRRRFNNYLLSQIKEARRLQAGKQLRRRELTKKGKEECGDGEASKEDAMRMLEEDDEIASGSYTDAIDEDEGEIETRGFETAETSSSLTPSTHGSAGKQDTISWQTFQEQEEKWHQRYEDIVVKLDAEFAQRSEKMEAKFAKRVEKINRKIKEQALENGRLLTLALGWETERIKREENFNLRWALERIVIHARLINKIEPHFTEGVQTGLDELAQTAEFQELLAKEIAARHVAKEDVDRCIAVLYRQWPEDEHVNSDLVTIHEEDYSANERAALATFLGVQGGWANGFKWREAKRA